MLKIKEIIDSSASSVEFDEYVPFTAEFEASSLSSPLYWRAGDGKQSLIEVGLCKQTGSVKSITLTSVKAENIRKINATYENDMSAQKGLPIFYLTKWSEENESDDFANNFIDEFDLDLQLDIGHGYISVSILGKEDPVRFVKNNNIVFGFDTENALSRIDIMELLTEDINIISSAI